MFAPYKTVEFDTPVKADPFSLDAIIAWLRTKPSDEVYCSLDTDVCLLGQWAQKCGFGGGREADAYFEFMKQQRVRGEVWPGLACCIPHTFGGALDRALSIKARKS